MGSLRCDMHQECTDRGTHIDVKGYAYCAKHAAQRKMSVRCRKLTSSELKQLEQGLGIYYESRKP